MKIKNKIGILLLINCEIIKKSNVKKIIFKVPILILKSNLYAIYLKYIKPANNVKALTMDVA